MKTNILRQSIIMGALAFAAAACTSDGDKFDYNTNVAFVSGTEVNPVTKFVVDEVPASQAITVSTSAPVKKDVTVTLAIDPAKVEEYNAANGTSFYCVPEGSTVLSSNTVTIHEGRALSDAVNVTVVSTENFEEGRTYFVPVTIKSADGVEVLDASGTIFLQVARTLTFTALSLDNPEMYTNFIFPDEKMVSLGAFTYEVKCYSRDWHRIARLCEITSKNEAGSTMLRFGENGKDINQLQWISPKGGIDSNTRFNTNQWYMLTMSYDGSMLTLYVDGVKDTETDWSGSVDFQRIELGMSWGGYRYSQRFNGYMAEMRIWNRALTAAEIQANLCGVDPQSEGLIAYFKFNEGDGHIFHDATGNGYDMDWSNTSRDVSEDGNMVATPDAANAVGWFTDPTVNRCKE